MNEIALTVFLLLLLFALLGSGIWVAFSLAVVGLVGMFLFTDAPVGEVMATTIWGASNSWALAALPLFIWMGEILFRSRLSEDMFSGLAPWMKNLPGRLLRKQVFSLAFVAGLTTGQQGEQFVDQRDRQDGKSRQHGRLGNPDRHRHHARRQVVIDK